MAHGKNHRTLFDGSNLAKEVEVTSPEKVTYAPEKWMVERRSFLFEMVLFQVTFVNVQGAKSVVPSPNSWGEKTLQASFFPPVWDSLLF